ncbi:LacI family DNA-binding transcriptional regulator [Pseudonocardia endophytica]|uniref:LacI family transcriptional regulator n=1 Tax=Pseudonocardia endophytica TaxID=401976 RepID=A0A4R1HM95_PSEEN|nr:LacI family DNA-binding transcriptional regulator [Pseudonocardia endophytica]TCK21665.1 LacI family transcriptional regulator [Pseudonocardia endophytica]
MATISDVAFRAGVSTATVSRAFNGKSTVDPALAERVFRAATELDYRPNSLARNLRRQATTVLALIVPDVENPYFTAVARGVEDCALSAGYSVVLCNSDGDPDKERRYVDVALQERMAGVVLSPTAAGVGVTALRERRTPVVVVDRMPPDAAVDQVSVDGRTAACEATTHLLAEGYRRIACLAGPNGGTAAHDRLDGFRDALRTSGRGDGGGLGWQADGHGASGALQAARRFLADDEPPDAVLATDSATAIGVLEAMAERGLLAGRDVGVVAFDDGPWGRVLDPALSVVVQPARRIGSEAAGLLLQRIAEPERPAERIVLDATLTVRGSSRRG